MTGGMDTPLAYKQLHETLVLACHEGVSTTHAAVLFFFGLLK